MDARRPLLPSASVEEQGAIAAALHPGENVCHVVRQCPAPLRWTGFRLFCVGFALVFLCAGVGLGLSVASMPLSWQEWARLDAFNLVFALLSLLFTLLPMVGSAAVGLGLLYLCGSREKAGLCVFTDSRLLVRAADGELTEHRLFPEMPYQLGHSVEGPGGSLILHGDMESLSSPLGAAADHLPDLREAEGMLLSLTRAEPVPEVVSRPPSYWVADVTESEADAVARILCRGESLRWAERPVPAFFTYGGLQHLAFFVLFSAVSAGGFVLGVGLDDVGDALGCGAIAGFMALLGLWGMLRPFLRRRELRHTLCLITDRRALVLEPDWRGKPVLYAYPLEPDMVARTRVGADGVGDLLFSLGDAQGTAGSKFGFLHVRDVARTQQELLAAVAARS